MRILLVKRIDSSFYAFKMSLNRFYDANKAMLKMLENGRVFISQKHKVSEFILNENEDELEEILMNSEKPEDIQGFNTEDFAEEFYKGIKQDNKVLEKLVNDWSVVTEDPKYNTFRRKIRKELFNNFINDNGKIVVFSESKETTSYLSEKLQNDGVKRILCVDSSNQKDLAETIAQNFDANYPINEQKDDYSIIITTEVLAEGVNLHRSNIILNYDIPWNATRLMQRIGRVNRVGTNSKRIFIYNFFPTSRTDNEIELNKKAYIKLQAFHSALGEDSQIYSEDEEFGTFGLFEKIPQEESDERLEYLNYLRKFRDEQPDDYYRIKNTIPKRARTGRKNKAAKDHSITFIKNKKRDSFYLIDKNLEIEELTFVEAARIYKAQMSENPIDLHDLHHDQINKALDAFEEDENINNLGDKSNVKLGPNESRAISFIEKKIMPLEFVNQNDKEVCEAGIKAIRRGKFQKLPREINKYVKQLKTTKPSLLDTYKAIINILNGYPLLDFVKEDEEKQHIKTTKKRIAKSQKPSIILSESFSA